MGGCCGGVGYGAQVGLDSRCVQASQMRLLLCQLLAKRCEHSPPWSLCKLGMAGAGSCGRQMWTFTWNAGAKAVGLLQGPWPAQGLGIPYAGPAGSLSGAVCLLGPSSGSFGSSRPDSAGSGCGQMPWEGVKSASAAGLC